MTSLLRSTGVKMFLILTLALLPLGLIALIASLQAIRTADFEKEALLRVAVTQSARKLASEIASDRAAMSLSVNAFASGRADPDMCRRVNAFLTSRGGQDLRFVIHDRAGRDVCLSPTAQNDKPPIPDRAAGTTVLLPDAGLLAVRTISTNKAVDAVIFYSRRHIERIADPATAMQSRQLSLDRGDQSLLISAPRRPNEGSRLSLSGRVEGTGLVLTMTVRDPPATLARTLSLFLPLVMWFLAAAIGWFVVNRLLIRPLVILRRTVAAYRPGEVMEPMKRIRTPAAEISALGDTFRAISEDVATHEEELAEGLERQRKLTREVHHRVKNNLQIIASLINLHARSAVEPEAMEAYASIQRRVDALSVVHRNHFAELEENRGVGVRSLISELTASLRGTAPDGARRFAIQIDCDDLHIHQDVAVPVAFLMTELVELSMLAAPQSKMRITVRAQPEGALATLTITSDALIAGPAVEALLKDRYERVLTGLSRQLRAPLAHDAATGEYAIAIRTSG